MHSRMIGHCIQPMSRFGNWVNGVILDDVFIVERALSASEVAIVHKLGIGGTATPVDPKGKVSTYWPEINPTS